MLIHSSSRFRHCIVIMSLQIVDLGLHLPHLHPLSLLYIESTNGYVVPTASNCFLLAELKCTRKKTSTPHFLSFWTSPNPLYNLQHTWKHCFPIVHVQAFRPTLLHPDFHFYNILVSHDDPTVVTGIVDWEYAAVLPFWDAYNSILTITDFGDTYENDSEWREEKRRLRSVCYDAVAAVCPDAAVLEDSSMQRSIKALRLFKNLSTSGVSLYHDNSL